MGAKRKTIIIETEPHVCIAIELMQLFFMANIASGMDHRRVRPTTTTSRDMADIQLIQHISFILIDSCDIKKSADQYHVTISRLRIRARQGCVYF